MRQEFGNTHRVSGTLALPFWGESPRVFLKYLRMCSAFGAARSSVQKPQHQAKVESVQRVTSTSPSV